MFLTKAIRPQIINTSAEEVLAEVVAMRGKRNGATRNVTIEQAKSVATAYRCMNIISDDVAKMPFQTFVSRAPGQIERMRPDGIAKNIAWRLERQPNRWWTPFWFKKISIMWLLARGNNYIWQPPFSGRELFILPADVTYPVFNIETGDLWYATKFAGDKSETYIPAVEIMHLMINPDETGYMGRGVVAKYAKDTISRQMNAYSSQDALFESGLSSAGILWLNGESSGEQRSKVRSMYEEVMSGPTNSGRIAVLDNTIAKYEAVTLNPRDVQFLEMIRDNDIAVMNFFGMPSYKLNTGKQSYQSNEQNHLDYLSTTLDPYLVQWEERSALSWLTTQEQAYTYFRFERSALYRTDAKSRGDYLNGAINNGRLTPNEARQVEDRQRYDDEAADKLYMNSGIQQMGVARSTTK